MRSLLSVVVALALASCARDTLPTDDVYTTTSDAKKTDSGTTGGDTGPLADPGPVGPDTPKVDAGPLPESPWAHLALGTTETVRRIVGLANGTFVAVGDHGTLLRYSGTTWAPEPHMTDADLLGAAAGNDERVYVVGRKGTFLVRDTAGWNVVDTGVTVDLYGVTAWDGHAYLVGDAGTVLRFDGKKVEPDVAKGASTDLRAVFAPPGGVPFAGGAKGTLYKRTGNQWVAAKVADAGVTFTDVHGTSGQFVVAVGSAGTIALTTGGTWSLQVSNDPDNRDLYGVWARSATEVYLAGDRGTAIAYDGKKWTTQTLEGPLHTIADLRAISGVVAGDKVRVVAGGTHGDAVTFDGKAWRDTTLATDVALLSVALLTASDALAVGEKGLMLRWTPYRGLGALASGTTKDLRGVASLGGGSALVVGESGVALRVDDGAAPLALDSGSPRHLNGVAGVGGAAVVVGDAGTALRYDGKGFVAETTGAVARIRAIALDDTGAGWAVGDGGAIVARSKDGTWTAETAPTVGNLNGVARRGAEAWAVGDNGLVLHRDQNGWTKEFESPGEFLFGVYTSPSLTLAVGWTGRILRRETTTWVAERSDTVNVLQAIAGSDGGPVFIVGRKGAVLRRQ